MTKTELIAAIANEMGGGTTKSHVRGFLTALGTVTGKSLRRDKKFVLPGIVKFQLLPVPPKAERKARNPATGKEMIVAAKPASKKLKARFLKPIKVDVGVVAASPKAPKEPKEPKEPKDPSAPKSKKTAKK
jgi:nucleoid DNA-binding protein